MMATPTTSSALAPIKASKTIKRVIISSMIGNGLEWYDFALYGYFSTLIAALFFPMEDPVVSLMATYGTFAAGFIMRPLGGLVFGLIGDRLGRKKALVWSIHLMSIPTFLMGLLPTYDMIGWLAPALLTCIRLLQGLSMGGEFTGSIVFIVEHAQQERRGFWGSLAPFSALLGILTGSGFAFFLTSLLAKDAMFCWGWRIPFLLSLAGGWVGTMIRKHLDETNSFKNKKTSATAKGASGLLRTLFQHHKRALATVFCVDLLVAVGFYLVVSFLVGYFEQFLHLTSLQALTVNTTSMILFAVTIPIAGYWLDRVGRKPIMVASAALFFGLSIPIFYLFLTCNLYAIFLGQGLLGILMGAYFAAIPAVLVESFPAHVRYSGISIAHNLSMAIFGGSAPFIATFLTRQLDTLLAPAFYLVFAALMAAIGLLFLQDATKKPLDTEDQEKNVHSASQDLPLLNKPSHDT